MKAHPDPALLTLREAAERIRGRSKRLGYEGAVFYLHGLLRTVAKMATCIIEDHNSKVLVPRGPVSLEIWRAMTATEFLSRHGHRRIRDLAPPDAPRFKSRFVADVRIKTSKLDALLAVEKPKRGRPPGSGKFDDGVLISEMRQLIHEDKAKNPSQAALQVAEKADGHGTLDSKAKRLERRYMAAERENQKRN